MKYYIASIHKGDPRDKDFEILEHYYCIRDDEKIKDKVLKSIKEWNKVVTRVNIYKYDFTIYDDEIQEEK